MDDTPELWSDLAWIMKAFLTLSGMRSFIGGMASFPAPVGFEAVDRYAARYGVVSIEEFDRFLILLRMMDGVYLEHQSNEAKKRNRKKK